MSGALETPGPSKLLHGACPARSLLTRFAPGPVWYVRFHSPEGIPWGGVEGHQEGTAERATGWGKEFAWRVTLTDLGRLPL